MYLNAIKSSLPIKSARVSSAQARGAAKRYAYWGAVRYMIRLTPDGRVVNTACERASSDRRSERLADRDLEALCDREGRIEIHTIGALSESAARRVWAWLHGIDLDACERTFGDMGGAL